jgi:pimeloyl-ACP methyl ester carboxylesterase
MRSSNSGHHGVTMLHPSIMRNSPTSNKRERYFAAGDTLRSSTPAMAEHILEMCPTATASWYDDVGHAPFLEDPARFNRELAELVHRVRP